MTKSATPMTEATLSESLEDYLEAIFHIVHLKQAARPKDIAKRLRVGNSSVTNALKALAARDLVNYAPYDIVTLTRAGEKAAQDVVRRHESLREFFVKVLAADPKLAEAAACRMEHAIPPSWWTASFVLSSSWRCAHAAVPASSRASASTSSGGAGRSASTSARWRPACRWPPGRHARSVPPSLSRTSSRGRRRPSAGCRGTPPFGGG